MRAVGQCDVCKLIVTGDNSFTVGTLLLYETDYLYCACWKSALRVKINTDQNSLAEYATE